jgi:alkanesulfonate monooxygenase SsuD/methylene tetrahydromethanopterin reductase-like flavin-dependent oxidoreductase (luciferase family)
MYSARICSPVWVPFPVTLLSKVGIALPITANALCTADFLEEVIEEVQVAEESGFGICMIPDHRQVPEVSLGAPLTVAAALIASTRRITLATGVLLAGAHHPLHLAEQIATLDNLARGRFVLGVGAGYLPGDFSPFNISLQGRTSRLEEVLEGLSLLLSGELVQYEGRLVSFRETRLRPVPFSTPRPPIWLGAWSRAGIARAARLADGWIADPIRSTGEIAEMAQAYRAECAHVGRSGTITVMREAWVEVDDQQAEEAFPEVIEPIFRYFRRRGALAEGPADGSGVNFDELSDRMVFGSPQTCANVVDKVLAETGADRVVLQLRHASKPDHARTVDGIRTLGAALAHFVTSQGDT